jgi:hypothetical protein
MIDDPNASDIADTNTKPGMFDYIMDTIDLDSYDENYTNMLNQCTSAINSLVANNVVSSEFFTSIMASMQDYLKDKSKEDCMNILKGDPKALLDVMSNVMGDQYATTLTDNNGYLQNLINKITFQIRESYEIINDSQIDCSICLDADTSTVGAKLECGHIFHKSCVDKWFGLNNCCPYCKNIISLDVNGNDSNPMVSKSISGFNITDEINQITNQLKNS